MPRFDFLCLDCKSTFEHLLPPGHPVPTCLKCGSENVQKLIALPSVIFKGSGFYKTDSTAKKGVGKKQVVEKVKEGSSPVEQGKSTEGPEGKKTEEKPKA